jgi:hypothetical protein
MLYCELSVSEARFTINVKEGVVELEGKESFVDKHLEKFEEIFKIAVKEAIARGADASSVFKDPMIPTLPSREPAAQPVEVPDQKEKPSNTTRHAPRTVPTIHPIPVDLKAGEDKVGLRDFYAEKKPTNHYEKVAVFAYYLNKFNKLPEVKFGEILSCYEEVNEKKPSILDIVKNSLRYKGWLEQGSEKYSARLTISGENFVKFDLPSQGKTLQPSPA